LKELYEGIDKEIAKSIKEVKTMRRLYNSNYIEADFPALAKVLEKEKETKKLVEKSPQTLNKIRQN
jgi:ABC-type Fe3+-hydroxamate transport system substrate-binding protein